MELMWFCKIEPYFNVLSFILSTFVRYLFVHVMNLL